ncbi:DUF262 domain-containing protein [Clostridium nigeriense]|uniref:DUF262 domain-containing protein n=1 Tax=Clostridium nigeriense TaxID=1805470 RepID=UPI003D326490
MENGQKTLNDLFDGKKIFRIPEYQRAYAWGEKQLSDFLDDFKNQKLNKDYFFGTILFQEIGKRGPYDIIEIVDGQQRITTLIIFINVLLSLYNECENETKEIYLETYIKYKQAYKLEVLLDDNEFFTTYILENNSVPANIISTPAQKKLYAAKKYFTDRLSFEFNQNQLKELLEKIEKTKVLTYSVQDKAEATLIFETTNDRGKQLTNLEKTKSFLMYKTYISSDEPELLLSNIQTRFSEIYKIYSNIDNLIDENSILQYNFIAYEEWKITQQRKEYQIYMDMMKNKVNYLISNDNKDVTLSYIDNYTKNLRETFSIMECILKSDFEEIKDIQILGNIANFYPLLIKAFKFDSTEDKRDFRKVCRLIEIFSFRVYNILRGMSNKGQSRFYKLAKDFNGDYNNLFSELKSSIKDFSSDKDFIDYISDTDFFTYYSSDIKNYFFWKYENYLRDIEQPVAAPIPYSVFKSQNKRYKFSIEHILPQKPTADTLKVITEQLVYANIDENFIDTYLHSIGNLTIDPISANASKGNSDINVKNNKYFKKAPFKTQNELEQFLDNGKWTHNSINARKEKLITFAKKMWMNYDNL